MCKNKMKRTTARNDLLAIKAKACFRQQVVKPRKGKGSYRRNNRVEAQGHWLWSSGNHSQWPWVQRWVTALQPVDLAKLKKVQTVLRRPLWLLKLYWKRTRISVYR